MPSVTASSDTFCIDFAAKRAQNAFKHLNAKMVRLAHSCSTPVSR